MGAWGRLGWWPLCGEAVGGPGRRVNRKRCVSPTGRRRCATRPSARGRAGERTNERTSERASGRASGRAGERANAADDRTGYRRCGGVPDAHAAHRSLSASGERARPLSNCTRRLARHRPDEPQAASATASRRVASRTACVTICASRSTVGVADDVRRSNSSGRLGSAGRPHAAVSSARTDAGNP